MRAYAMKWPNDVLLGSKKLAGILLETEGQHLIVGIGVNLVKSPGRDEVEPGALSPISLSEATGMRVSPEALLDEIAPAYDYWESRLTSDGFAPLREAWLDRAAGIGEKITARLADRVETGIFETIDNSGALVLRQDTGMLTLPAADIHFG